MVAPDSQSRLRILKVIAIFMFCAMTALVVFMIVDEVMNEEGPTPSRSGAKKTVSILNPFSLNIKVTGTIPNIWS